MRRYLTVWTWIHLMSKMSTSYTDLDKLIYTISRNRRCSERLKKPNIIGKIYVFQYNILTAVIQYIITVSCYTLHTMSMVYTKHRVEMVVYRYLNDLHVLVGMGPWWFSPTNGPLIGHKSGVILSFPCLFVCVSMVCRGAIVRRS